MSTLINISGRAWIAADHVKFVTWRATVNPFTDPVTGKSMRASVTIETYHDSYRIPFETPADAQAAAESVVLAAVLERSAPARRLNGNDSAVADRNAEGLTSIKLLTREAAS